MDKQLTERTPRKCFRTGSEYNLIAKCTKPHKDNEKRRNQFRFNERGNHASQKESENGDNENDQKIQASMARMSVNDKSSSIYFSDSLQLTNLILDSGATCHMTPYV